jgi:hypothetical protein
MDFEDYKQRAEHLQAIHLKLRSLTRDDIPRPDLSIQRKLIMLEFQLSEEIQRYPDLAKAPNIRRLLLRIRTHLHWEQLSEEDQDVYLEFLWEQINWNPK